MKKEHSPFRFMGIVFAWSTIFLFSNTCADTWRQEVQEAPLHDVDLSQTADGTYTGQHSYRDFVYSVKAVVVNHTITEIEIVAWDRNEARERALAIFDKVIARQSLCVDAVSGATTASKLYLLCLDDAFPADKPNLCPIWNY